MNGFFHSFPFAKREIESTHPSDNTYRALRDFPMDYPSLKKRGRGDFPDGSGKNPHEQKISIFFARPSV
jgi:hypothetical protein